MNLKAVGIRIKEAREAKHLTQEQLYQTGYPLTFPASYIIIGLAFFIICVYRRLPVWFG